MEQWRFPNLYRAREEGSNLVLANRELPMLQDIADAEEHLADLEVEAMMRAQVRRG